MFRGGAGQMNSSRRPGDAQAKENKQYGGTKDPPPRTQTKDTKAEQTTPAKQPPSAAPGKTPTSKPNEQNGPRARSRSPIDRKGQTSNDIDAQQSSEEKKEEKTYKYTGRPGEKKFSGRCRLFVANLHNTTTEQELKELFSEFGETGEVYVNRDKGFGFIRMDFRHNAEMAKLTLDKKLVKGRNIQVRYATHASAIELHGLDNFASNDFIEKAMSTFGAVERCVVVCDDRGRSKGYAVVEFEWKKSAAKVLDRLKDEMFVLGRLPKPVFAKPFVLTDEEEGVQEESLERLEGLETERAHEPRFISPNSFEYTWAKRWRDLFIEEQDKKARLEQEMTDARCKLEFEMEAAIRQQEASRIREELARRQEELRMLSEDMMRRQEADMRILERSRQRELAARQGHPEPPPRDGAEVQNNEIQLSRENAARQQDFLNLRQRAEMTLQNETFPNDGRGPPPRQQSGGMAGMRPEMMGGGSSGFGQQRGPPQQQGGYGGYGGGHSGGGQGGPRSQHPGMDYRSQQQQRGPPREMQQREMQQREMQQREMQQRGMQQRGMEGRGDMPAARDIPPARDQPARELVKETAPKDNPAEEKTVEPAAAAGGKLSAEVDPSKRAPRR